MSVIEQITYLLFIKRLDELAVGGEHKAGDAEDGAETAHHPRGEDPRGMAYDRLRWSRLKTEERGNVPHRRTSTSSHIIRERWRRTARRPTHARSAPRHPLARAAGQGRR
jgi:hypothetical protein